MKNLYTLAELEAAINYWRSRSPSAGEELALCKEAAALAEPYAFMILQGHTKVSDHDLTDRARNALQAWKQATAPG